MQEVIYQRALAYEVGHAGLDFAREIEQEIYYKDLAKPICTRKANFVVEGKVNVEIKVIDDSPDCLIDFVDLPIWMKRDLIKSVSMRI